MQRVVPAPMGLLAAAVVALATIALLAAIAAPQYKSYVAKTRAGLTRTNFEMAVGYVKVEVAKKAIGERATRSAVDDLNSSGRRNPYNAAQSAFAQCDSSGTLGQVCISKSNIDGAVIGTTVSVSACYDLDGDGRCGSSGEAPRVEVRVE